MIILFGLLLLGGSVLWYLLGWLWMPVPAQFHVSWTVQEWADGEDALGRERGYQKQYLQPCKVRPGIRGGKRVGCPFKTQIYLVMSGWLV